ncbi:hypothetical protein N9M65_01860 [Luminiphilus sp.]|nr:hypothetical protein [Luminiphilus sp.]
MLKSRVVTAIGILALSQVTLGASFTGTFAIQQIVTDGARYSGCMIRVTPAPETVFAGCKIGFVSLGCDGTLGITKSAASNLLSAAQLALVTDRSVVLRINDEDAPTSPRGYCLADRVDVIK